MRPSIFERGLRRSLSFEAAIESKMRFHPILPQCGIGPENTQSIERLQEKDLLILVHGDASLGENPKLSKVPAGRRANFQESAKVQILRIFR